MYMYISSFNSEYSNILMFHKLNFHSHTKLVSDFITLTTVEPPLRRHHRDQEECLLNRDDNCKDYMSVLPTGTRRTVPLIES